MCHFIFGLLNVIQCVYDSFECYLSIPNLWWINTVYDYYYRLVFCLSILTNLYMVVLVCIHPLRWPYFVIVVNVVCALALFSHSFWHSFEFVQIQNVCLCVGANHSHLQVLVLRFVCNFMAQSTPVHVICHTIFEYLCGAQIFLCLARTHSHILCAYVYDVHLIF